MHEKEIEDDNSDIEKNYDRIENGSVNANLRETKDDVEKVEEGISEMVDFVKGNNDVEADNLSSKCRSESKKVDEVKELDEDTSKYQDLLEKIYDIKITDVHENKSDDKDNGECVEIACEEIKKDVESADNKIESDVCKSKSDYSKICNVIETLDDLNKLNEKVIENAKESEVNEEVSSKVSEVKTNSEIADSEMNLVCNKCNKKRTTVETECCVDGGDKLDTNDTGVKKEEFASVDLGSAIALINR